MSQAEEKQEEQKNYDFGIDNNDKANWALKKY